MRFLFRSTTVIDDEDTNTITAGSLVTATVTLKRSPLEVIYLFLLLDVVNNLTKFPVHIFLLEILLSFKSLDHEYNTTLCKPQKLFFEYWWNQLHYFFAPYLFWSVLIFNLFRYDLFDMTCLFYFFKFILSWGRQTWKLV